MNSICATRMLWNLEIQWQAAIGNGATCVETCDVPHPLKFTIQITKNIFLFTFASFCYLQKGCSRAIPINAYEKLFKNQYLIVQQIDGSVFYLYTFSRHNLCWVPLLLYIRLACRCAKESRAIAYSYFGLQFFGECWSDAQVEERYKRYGKSSECVGFEYKTCSDEDENECVGGGNKNYVYKIVEGKGRKILKKS